MNLLLEGAGMPAWGILIVFVVLIAVMIIPTYLRNKKENARRNEIMSQLKTGDSIITTAGVFGKIISARETTMGKVYVIETGDSTHKSYQEIHADAIMAVDTKKDIVLDAEGNDITFAEEDKKEEVKEVTNKETKEEKSEEPAKTEQKKTTRKRTTKKN